MIRKVFHLHQWVMEKFSWFDFIALLFLRLYLAPVYCMSGIEKINHMSDTVHWFANDLGLPFPALMAHLAAYTEVVGAVLLFVGFATRWATIPLMIVMLVAAATVHFEHGWWALAHQDHESTSRLHNVMLWLKQHYPMRHAYLTELGTPVILRNGVEFAATYFVMLLTLFSFGPGRWLSIDYWIKRWFTYHHVEKPANEAIIRR
ncbi:MAG: DoxX family protein [Gammaproteobacteria bacterium]